jgi:hypothetical protein
MGADSRRSRSPGDHSRGPAPSATPAVEAPLGALNACSSTKLGTIWIFRQRHPPRAEALLPPASSQARHPPGRTPAGTPPSSAVAGTLPTTACSRWCEHRRLGPRQLRRHCCRCRERGRSPPARLAASASALPCRIADGAVKIPQRKARTSTPAARYRCTSGPSACRLATLNRYRDGSRRSAVRTAFSSVPPDVHVVNAERDTHSVPGRCGRRIVARTPHVWLLATG